MKNTMFSFTLIWFLSFGCLGQSSVEKEAAPFTKKLSSIDKIELIKLKVKGDLWDGSSIEGIQIVEGKKRKKSLLYGEHKTMSMTHLSVTFLPMR